MNYTVRVRGLREMQAAFRQANGRLDPGIKAALKEVAEPVRAGAQARGSRYTALGPYRVVVRARGVAVEQSARTVTGLRGDFGALQMRRLLEPELAARQVQIRNGLRDAIDEINGGAGLL